MKKYILLLSAVSGISLLAGCSGDAGEKAAVESVAYICGIGSTAKVERYAGVLESGSDIMVEKNSEKKVGEILVKAGDTVTKDQVLFRYDKAQTELNLEKVKIEIEQLESSVAGKQAEIDTIQNEINGGNLDADTKTGYTLQIQELNADITETGLSIRSKQADLDNLQNTLNNLEVKSPDEGVIQSVNEDGNDQESAFIVIRKTGALRAKGYVNESNIGSLYEGMEVLIRSRVDDVVQKGSIKSIDLKNPVSAPGGMDYGMESDDTATSGKYPFFVELGNTEGFIMGQHVYIEPDHGQGEASESGMMLPSYYINEAEAGPWVWARDGRERLEKRTVSLGNYDPETDTYEVKSGLTAQDYIAAPEDTLKTGMKCVEFDFTSDMPAEFTFEENGTDDGVMTDTVPGINGSPDGNFHGGSPSGMRPFFSVPAVIEGSGGDEAAETENAQGSEKPEEAQKN